MLKLSHLLTNEPPEKCVLCPAMTPYKASYAFLPMVEIRKPLCPECAKSIVNAADLIGKIASTLQTNTNPNLSGENKQ